MLIESFMIKILFLGFSQFQKREKYRLNTRIMRDAPLTAINVYMKTTELNFWEKKHIWLIINWREQE